MMRKEKSSSTRSQKQCEETLKICLRTHIPTLDEESFGQCLQARQKNFSSALLTLIEEFPMNRNVLLKIRDEIGRKILEDGLFAEWIGDSYAMAWLAIQIAQQFDQPAPTMAQFLRALSSTEVHFSDLLNFIYFLGDRCKVKELEERRVHEVAKKISTDQTWKKLQLRFGLRLFENLPLPDLSDESSDSEARENSKRQNEMKKDLQAMNGSVLDELIQQNLILAFQCEVLHGEHYGENNYRYFTQRLSELAKSFEVYSNTLRQELEEIPEKNKLFNKILNIRSKIHPVFVQQLVNLLSQSKKAREAIRGKDTIVLLGSSGAGKTTTVQVLLKYKLIKQKDRNGIDTLVPTVPLSQEHSQFVAKASSRSVTKYVSAIPIGLADYGYPDRIYLVDTPGFFDTGGLVVDACNSLSTIDVLATANSIRFGFIFNYKAWGKKPDAFRDFLKVISGLFFSYQKNKSKVVYFLNEFSEEEIQNFPARIREFANNGLNPSDKGNKKLGQVLDHFKELLRKAESIGKTLKISLSQAIRHELVDQLMFIDPLNPDLEKVYMKLLNPDRRIIKPQAELESIVSEDVRQALRSEVTQLECIINSCISNKKIEALKYYLNSLNEIAEITKDVKDCAQARLKYDKIVEKMKDQVYNKFKLFQENMNRILSLRNEEDTFVEFKNKKEQLQQLQTNYKCLSGFETIDKTQQIGECVQEISNKLTQKLQESEMIGKDLYCTVKLFSKYFYPQQSHKFQAERKKKQQKLQSKITVAIENNDFSNFDEDFSKMKYICELANQTQPKFEENKLKQLKQKAEKKSNQIFFDFKKLLQQKQSSECLIRQGDIDNINKYFKVFSTNSILLPSLQENFSQCRRGTLKLFRKFVEDINEFMKGGSEIFFDPRQETKAFNCKMNAKELGKVDVIKNDAEYELLKIDQDLSNEIKARKSNLDQMMPQITSQKFDNLNKIYKEMIGLRKLNSLCSPAEALRSQNYKTINQSESLLKERLDELQESFKIASYSLQNFNSKAAEEILRAYKICYSITKDHEKKQTIMIDEREENSAEQRDKIITICQKIIETIKQKIKCVLREIQTWISEMETYNTKENIQKIREGLVVKYYRIRKFFYLIKSTSFSPESLNQQIKSDMVNFENTFSNNYSSFDKFAVENLNEMANSLRQKKMQPISQRKLQNIIKLRKIIDQINHIPDLQPDRELSNEEMNSELPIEMGQQNNFNYAIENLQGQLKLNFNDYSRSSAYEKCCYLISECKSLERLDIIHSKKKFKELATELQNGINQSTKIFDEGYKTILALKSIDNNLLMLRKTLGYFGKFEKETNQYDKFKDILEHLRFLFTQKQQSVMSKLKTTSEAIDWSSEGTNVDLKPLEDEVYGIFKMVKQINLCIKNESEKFAMSPGTLEYLSDTNYNMISNYSRKIENFIKKKEYKEAESLYIKIKVLEGIFKDFKIQNEKYAGHLKRINEKEKEQFSSIALYYKRRLQQIRQDIDRRYKGPKIEITSNFTEEILTLDPKQQTQIKQTITKQIKETISQYQRAHSNQTVTLIEHMQGIEQKEKINHLPFDVKSEITKQIQDKLRILRDLKERQENSAKTNFNFINLYDLTVNEKRKNIQEIYEKMGRAGLQKRVNEFKESRTAASAIDLMKIVLINLVDGKNIDQHPQFKKMYQDSCKKVIKAVEQDLIENRADSLKMLSSFKKPMRNQENESISKIGQNATEIKNVIQFMLRYQSKASCLEPTKYLRKLEGQFTIVGQQLKKKSQISFEDIKKEPLRFFAWNYQSRAFNRIMEEFKMTQFQELTEFYTKFEGVLEEINKKENELKETFTSIVQDLQSLRLYSENGKNVSDNDRRAELKLIQDKINTLASLEKLQEPGKNFFGQKLKELANTAKNRIKNEIEQKIASSCEEVKKGFGNLGTEFNKQINVSLTYANEAISFITIDKNLKMKLISTIESCYASTEVQLQAEIDKLMEIKTEQQLMMKVSQKTASTKKEQLKKEAEQQEQEMKEEEDRRLADAIDGQTDQKIIEDAKAAHYNEVNLKKRQIWDQYKENCGQIDSETQKSQLDMNNQLTLALKVFCDLITRYFKAAFQLNYKQDSFKNKLEEMLADYKRVLGRRKFNLVFETLRQRRNSYSSFLIGSLEAFRNHQTILWEAKIKGNTIEDVLKQLKLKDSKKHSVKAMHTQYQNEFKQWTKNYQNNPTPATINNLLENIKNSAQIARRFYDNQLKSEDFKPAILIAQIMVLWTILQSQIDEDEVIYTFQPHTAQILTIFLCLSLLPEDFPRDLNSKLAQVGTGEGKSLILAAIASYLALCGFEVSCVCYSQHLSSRDYKAFAKLFQELQIVDKIKYGTFNSVCEALLSKDSKSDNDFTSQIRKILQGQPESIGQGFWNMFKNLFKKMLPSMNRNNWQSKKIMLIDEVDVFFNGSFFGKVYRPEVCISSPEIKDLIRQVWRSFKENDKITDVDIKQKQQFAKAERKFKNFSRILNEQVKGMIMGCRSSNQEYEIRDDHIMYKDQDGLSSKLSYGFSTLFAYLKEHDLNRIASIQKALKISCIVAEFSYAMLPKYFKCIIGVTGTYDEMPQFHKHYLRDEYQVKDVYAIPSVYGTQIQKRRHIHKQKVTKPQDHHKKIMEEIVEVNKSGRPVLVFFENKRQLHRFFNHSDFSEYRDKTAFLTGSHLPHERESRILKACQKGRITLMTRDYGRGTDFKVFDESIFTLGTHGGLHVIQTFLSVENSEEVQIRGRTARQGDPGTYILIIKDSDLERLEMKFETIRNFEQQIKKGRAQKEQKQHEEVVKMLKECKQKHEQCLNVYMNENVKETNILKYIENLNKFPEIRSNTCKTAILIDGTISMSRAVKILCAIFPDVMSGVSQIISRYPNAMESQLLAGVYRNYNCSHDEILQVTPFDSRPQSLSNFLSNIEVNGGMGNEALEIVYNYLNRNKEIDQAIIIGDAAANTDEETKENRAGYQEGGQKGEAYWSKYYPILSAQRQLDSLVRNRKIPIHCFYIKADQYFKQVSDLTHGKAEKFQVHSKEASRKLSDFIAQRILEKVAQSEGEANRMIRDWSTMMVARYS